jgi:hypothetical protein
MNKEIKPLYRKVNTKARNVWHMKGSDAKYDRNTKTGVKGSMGSKKNRGLDYTPLYMFLLSKVGKDFDDVYSEAVARLDNDEAIYHLVLRDGEKMKGSIMCGESSRYNTLYVDENNLLQLVNPSIRNEHFFPSCHCCTHTFNGKVLTNKYVPYIRSVKMDNK